jgi:hypothetical protein
MAKFGKLAGQIKEMKSTIREQSDAKWSWRKIGTCSRYGFAMVGYAVGVRRLTEPTRFKITQGNLFTESVTSGKAGCAMERL